MELNIHLCHMGQYKKAIFIGRDGADTGLAQYRQLAKLKKITLDIFTHTPNAAKYLPQYDVAFVSRYLAILEALAAGIPIVAHYNNEIKKDYLTLAPFAKFITIFSDPAEVKLEYNWRQIRDGQRWASGQTWDNLVDIYEKLWTRQV